MLIHRRVSETNNSQLSTIIHYFQKGKISFLLELVFINSTTLPSLYWTTHSSVIYCTPYWLSVTFWLLDITLPTRVFFRKVNWFLQLLKTFCSSLVSFSGIPIIYHMISIRPPESTWLSYLYRNRFITSLIEKLVMNKVLSNPVFVVDTYKDL